ncbi:hypothetical protein jhhlp_006603 [Lomentospora prolificans]|uniref:Uncharacterized protein n=1 Tax=Lomentospora prolificans TaxID=41688 RepID=A0A2N3N6C9_9PEZI|nr:hypothetical protein jhhlp_006603 [Lomentospora prolificans]
MVSRLPLTLLLFSLVSCGLSLDQKKWTLLNFERKCDHKTSSCDYSFFISEDEGNIFPCNFHVVSMLPDIVPASNLTFSGIRCSNSSKYDINVDLTDGARVIVMSIVKPEKGILAYFKYPHDEINKGDDAKPQTSDVYPLVPPESDEDPWFKSRKGNTGEDPLAYAARWKLFSPIRRIRDDVGKNVLNMAFMLLAEDHGDMICNVHLTYPKGKNAQTHSFFHEKCTNNDWYVSWGYDEDKDSAVMTVINPKGDRHAWFGWDDVNKRDEQLGSNGPGKTEARKPEDDL